MDQEEELMGQKAFSGEKPKASPKGASIFLSLPSEQKYKVPI
jgi:hypothetical protein